MRRCSYLAPASKLTRPDFGGFAANDAICHRCWGTHRGLATRSGQLGSVIMFLSIGSGSARPLNVIGFAAPEQIAALEEFRYRTGVDAQARTAERGAGVEGPAGLGSSAAAAAGRVRALSGR